VTSSDAVSLGPSGVEEVHAIGAVSAYEEDLIKKSLPELQASSTLGTNLWLRTKDLGSSVHWLLQSFRPNSGNDEQGCAEIILKT